MIDKDFLQDVISGLHKKPKELNPKYFYNSKGDLLFQEITELPEYYLTNCEAEIINREKETIIDQSLKSNRELDIVELGPGNGSKSVGLIEHLFNKQKALNYYPIDISPDTIRHLTSYLSTLNPEIQVKGLMGDYFEMMKQIETDSGKNKLVLFLGSSIGNMSKEASVSFLKKLRSHLNSGDMLFIGFDLIKDPGIILKAYDDDKGVTRDFNLNLLHRINEELSGNFNTDNFIHSPIYDSTENACKSYLISTKEQKVDIGRYVISFRKGEAIFMETSQKFRPEEIDLMSKDCGFSPLNNFFDEKHWFLNALWQIKP